MEATSLSFLDITKFESTVLWIALLVCFAVYFVLTWRRTNIPGPTGIPILGYLPFLGKDAHLTLMKLSQKYGSIFGLYLGRKYVVVVTDYNLAKEIITKPTAQYRPPDIFHLVPDQFGFATLNGQEWTEQRRYTVREMKNLGLSGSKWEKHVQNEMMDFLSVLKESNGEPLRIDKPLSASISNNILSLSSGHRLPAGDPGREILDKGVDSFAEIYPQSSIINYFPTLFKIAVKLGFLKVGDKIKNVENMNKFVKRKIDESKKEGNDNYINNYLKETENRKNLDSMSFFNERNLVGNVQALLTGGTETTKLSIMWLFLAMAAFPDIQDKVQNELDSVLCEGQIACWEDRRKLPYCYATVLEGQRWRTLAPLNLLRRTSGDIEIQGYIIPKNTDVIAMLWAFHNDTRYWKDPEKFLPERFLTDDGNAIGKAEAFEPFSMGKRRCPGETVAYITIFTYFTNILYKFRILPEKDDETPDLTGTLGLTFSPKMNPLRFVPRTGK